ncbi:MAG TPA: hypothetical protein VJ549_02295 [Geothrix sp.]|nr:hypothetical protein [Geothrix sp.]
MALRLYLERQHAAFIAEVAQEEATPWPAPSGAVALVVPGLYYKERPDLGGDGELPMQVAKACGFEARRVASLSLGTVRENARILKETLASCGNSPVLVVSQSIGALHVRQVLAELGPEDPAPFRGWLNVGGTPNGAHAIARMLGTPTRRMAGRILAKVQGLPFEAVEESMPAHPLWQGPFPSLRGASMVTLLPIPLECQVQKPLQARFAELKGQGPNDGMVLLAESLPPGDVYPMWGSDHLLRTPAAGETLYRLFRWFRRRIEAEGSAAAG